MKDVRSSPIVRSFSFDQVANTVSVSFNSYDSPYTGDVLTYSIGLPSDVTEENPEGVFERKAVRIEG